MMDLVADDLPNGVTRLRLSGQPDVTDVLKTARIDAIVPLCADLVAAAAVDG